MKYWGSMLILLALAGGCSAHRTVVYEPAAAPAYVVTSPAYVATYDSRTACEAAGGHWHAFTRNCTF